MLEKYESLIYADKAAKEETHRKCIQFVKDNHPNSSIAEIDKALNSAISNDIIYDYEFCELMTEGKLLFDKVASKFGEKLWRGNAWKNATCRRKCPFGDICKKEIVQIDDDFLCFGQLYDRKISEKKLLEKTEAHIVKFIRQNGDSFTLTACLSDSDKETLSSWFFEYEYFIWWFGSCGRKGGKVSGVNVISLL